MLKTILKWALPVAGCTYFLIAYIHGHNDNKGHENVKISYKPFVLPFRLTYDSQGNLSVSLASSFTTPIGEFVIHGEIHSTNQKPKTGEDYSIYQKPDTRLVVVRDLRDPQKATDKVIRVATKNDDVGNNSKPTKIDGPPIVVEVSDSPPVSVKFTQAGTFAIEPLDTQPETTKITSTGGPMYRLSFIQIGVNRPQTSSLPPVVGNIQKVQQHGQSPMPHRKPAPHRTPMVRAPHLGNAQQRNQRVQHQSPMPHRKPAPHHTPTVRAPHLGNAQQRNQRVQRHNQSPLPRGNHVPHRGPMTQVSRQGNAQMQYPNRPYDNRFAPMPPRLPQQRNYQFHHGPYDCGRAPIQQQTQNHQRRPH